MLMSVAVRVQTALASLPLGPIDNPDPKAPAGLDGVAQDWIAWAKWGAMVCGIIGLLVSAMMMAIGRRNRSHLAGEGATGIPWVVAALSIAVLAVPVVNAISGQAN